MPAIFGVKGGSEISQRAKHIQCLSRKYFFIQVIGKQSIGDALYRNPRKWIDVGRGAQGIGTTLLLSFKLQY